MKRLFNQIDIDGSNNLSLKEVVLYFKSITDDLSDDNIKRIFDTFDINEDKTLDFDEFKVKPDSE